MKYYSPDFDGVLVFFFRDLVDDSSLIFLVFGYLFCRDGYI